MRGKGNRVGNGTKFEGENGEEVAVKPDVGQGIEGAAGPDVKVWTPKKVVDRESDYCEGSLDCGGGKREHSNGTRSCRC